jgi:hypothetical protein
MEKINEKKWKKSRLVVAMCSGWRGELQWQGGSSTNRKSKSRRFELYKLERDSVNIDRVAVNKNEKNREHLQIVASMSTV